MISFDMPMSEYLAHSAIGSSTLRNIMSTPADYRAVKDQRMMGIDNPNTDSTIFGTAGHYLLLEPHKYLELYALQPEDWGPKNKGTKKEPAGKQKWDAFKEANEGKTCIDFDDVRKLQRIADAAKAHPELQRILSKAKFEVTTFAHVEGVELKARIDILCEDTIWDLKTCRESLDDDNLFKIVFNCGYHFQGAHHTSVISAHPEHKNVRSYGWIFVSTSTPHPHIRIVKAPQTLIDWSRRDHSYALTRLKQCLQTNTWEGYSTAVTELAIPEWAKKMYE